MYESRNITNIRALRNSPGIRQPVSCLQIMVAAKKSQPEQDLIFLATLPYFCRFVRTSYSLVDKVSREPVPKAAHHYFFGTKVILDFYWRKVTLVCWKNGIHCFYLFTDVKPCWKGLITRWVTIWEITPICIPWRVDAYNASHLPYMVIVCGEGFSPSQPTPRVFLRGTPRREVFLRGTAR